MASIIEVTDLPASIQAAESVALMVAGANAKASRVAPCLADSGTPPTEDQLAEAKLVLAGAVKRWVEAGAGSLASETVGPFGHTIDTRQRTGFNFWPSEIEALQDICSEIGTAAAFSIDTAPPLDGYAESPDWWGYETTDGSRITYEG